VAAAAPRGTVHGRAVQVDPIKPTLKPPRTKRLKLNHDVLLSTFAFKFILRRYIMMGADRPCLADLLIAEELFNLVLLEAVPPEFGMA